MKLLLEKDKERLSYKHKKKIYARLLRGATIELWKTFQQKLWRKKKDCRMIALTHWKKFIAYLGLCTQGRQILKIKAKQRLFQTNKKTLNDIVTSKNKLSKNKNKF